MSYSWTTDRESHNRAGVREACYARAAMAEKLGILDQMLFGKWADRAAINRNAEHLSNVAEGIDELRKVVQLQGDEILRLRAMFLGVVEVLHAKAPFDDAELERAVEAAWNKLKPPPPKQPSTAADPYRGTPGDASAADTDAAKGLLATAQSHHFSQRFADAKALYQQIVDQYGNTKQAATARQQLENLRKA
jgi:TolA-binding protein